MKLIEAVQAQSARLDQAGVSFGHGTTNAFDEAAWLVLWALQLPLDELERHAERVLSIDEQSQAEALVTRRIASRTPAAYLTHEAWLHGVPFYVDERAIVPRSLIAELIVDGGFDNWLSPRTQRVLDLCTGNGSLAIFAALAWPDVDVDATDISDDALAVARINVERHALEARIRLLRSNLFDAVDAGYDLILCNPPYVSDASMATLPAEYRAEPALALAGGADGLDLVRALLAQAPTRMSEHAVLVLEIGNQRACFEASFPTLEVVWLSTSENDDQVLLVAREALR